ncbi:hypothetical protein BCR37DRAFT_259734 [Protomyces lactucae-debilis]|uniref:IPT/TIG domain-containing protein n=1 Tax=Protomyces lactucae-debilis TaxID=2754530 RepID=A0A1Y2FLW2_PROLT|nr:uncharacterized protein BCR37DRAFT_259734 [Protomyces lactucae-debilis]ORY84206.1 hypothetical protein BCR37DRAFT_259734 [Protomyces lactucae-debilis]
MLQSKPPSSPAMNEYLRDLGDDLFFGELSSDSLLRPRLYKGEPSPAESEDSPSSHSDSMAEDSDLFALDHNGHRSSLDTVLTDAGDKMTAAPAEASLCDTKAFVPAVVRLALPPTPAPAPVYQLQLTGIPDKSRVETQIKLGLHLVELMPDGSQKTTGDRFQWLKLPAWGMAKEKLKLKNRRDTPDTIDPHKIIFLDARVVKSGETQEDVQICHGCIIRERKRAQRKKDSAKHKARIQETAVVPPQEIPLADEEKKILVFNCPELLEMENGRVVVPTRVTCYCRHHKEKVGFRMIITLRDASSSILATTTSELVLITDDHKTLGNAKPVPTKAGEEGPPSQANTSANVSPQQASSAQMAQSRRSSISSAATSRKRKADPVNIAPNLAPKIQKVPSSLSMTRMAKDELQNGLRREPLPVVPMSASTSRAVSPSTARSLHRTQSQDSLLQFMNLQDERELLTDVAQVHSPSRSQTWEASIDESMDRGISLSPRTRTLEYLMDSASRQAGVAQHFANQGRALGSDVPTINRLIPAEGPLQGGVEVTILGSGFYPGLTCMFGEVAAVPTHCWSPTTMVCVLPPSSIAGVVSVTFREHPYNAFVPTSFPGKPFTYLDDTDRALMELALQVIGLKSTGKLETARVCA